MLKLEEQLREATERNLDDDLKEENQQLKERVKN
jgi:dynactin complex subunit